MEEGRLKLLNPFRSRRLATADAPENSPKVNLIIFLPSMRPPSRCGLFARFLIRFSLAVIC